MEQVQIGIIGGSGLYDMADVTDRREVPLTTPFGEPSGPYVTGTLRGKRVAFLARHPWHAVALVTPEHGLEVGLGTVPGWQQEDV